MYRAKSAIWQLQIGKLASLCWQKITQHIWAWGRIIEVGEEVQRETAWRQCCCWGGETSWAEYRNSMLLVVCVTSRAFINSLGSHIELIFKLCDLIFLGIINIHFRKCIWLPKVIIKVSRNWYKNEKNSCRLILTEESWEAHCSCWIYVSGNPYRGFESLLNSVLVTLGRWP